MEPNYRRCVSCRSVAPKGAFWRIVRIYSSGMLELDRGMGRSAYLCPQASCLSAAQKKNRLGKALKVRVPEDLYQTLWQRLSPSSPTDQMKTAGETLAHSQTPPKPSARRCPLRTRSAMSFEDALSRS